MIEKEYREYPKDSRYSVASDGTIKGAQGNVLAGVMCRGYRFIAYVQNKQIKQEKVARMVAMCWVHNPNPKKFNVVNHINGIKSDDRASNLEWCTQSRNMIHANEMDLLKFGSNHYLSKLLECQVKVIKSGLLTKLTDQEIGNYFKVSRATINRIRHGVSWKRVKGVLI